MKRCPQCLFLYPESDERCDFDQTPLEAVDDAEVDRATKTRRPRRGLLIAVPVGLILGVVTFATYYGLSHRVRKTSVVTEAANSVAPVAVPSPTTLPSPSPVVSPSPSPSPSPRP